MSHNFMPVIVEVVYREENELFVLKGKENWKSS
jgi:hypothetical protein